MTTTRADIIDPATVGAGFLAAALQRQGVHTTFGICGHLDLFFGAMEDIGMRLIGMRHEAAVVHAADAYARVSGRLGVGIVTAGPGIANAVGGLASANEAGTPLLIIAGRNALNLLEMGAMQELDAPRLVRSVTKWARTVHEVSRLGEYVDTAARVALSGRPGPVLLEVPSDLMFEAPDERARVEAMRPVVRPGPVQPESAAIERAAAVLARAERPLVIAGNGAYWGRAGHGLRTLALEFLLPVLGKGLARGLVPEDMVTGFPWTVAQAAAPLADVVLLVGTRINQTLSYANRQRFDPRATFIQIDIEPEEIGRNHYIDIPIAGDAGLAVHAIVAALRALGYRGVGVPHWINQGIAEKLDRLDEVGREETGLVHPLRIARELAPRLAEDAIIVGDGAACLNWFNAVLRVRHAPGWLDHSPFGCMGVGVPFAIGAVAAEQDRAAATGASPREVALVTGDGSFGFYIAELATAADYGLPFFGVIANDGAWGANRVNQKRNLGRNYGTTIAANHYEIVARGFDCHGEFADAPADVAGAIERALAAYRTGIPAIVNVMCDPEAPELLRDDPRVALGAATGNLRNPVTR